MLLHVLAAAVWVGGQLILVGMWPALRNLGPDAQSSLADRFEAIAWAAYGVLVVTGLWNLVATDVNSTDSPWQVTLLFKLGAVAVAGVGAYQFPRAPGRSSQVAWAAAGGVASLAALWLGVLLSA